MARLIDAELLQFNILEEYGADAGSEDVNIIYGMVINAPTIEAEPVRHGKWIYIKGDYDENNNRNCVCSECAAGDSHARGVTVPYCWKCGAKMDLD